MKNNILGLGDDEAPRLMRECAYFVLLLPSPTQFLISHQSPSYTEVEKFHLKSRDSLSSGMQLSVSSDKTMTVYSEQEHPSPPLLSPEPPHQRAPSTQGLLRGSRFPSLPEHLEASSEHQDIQRHLSDPVLPGS